MLPVLSLFHLSLICLLAFAGPVSASAKIWTDSTGRSIDAEFVSFDGTQVVLRSNATQKQISVPLERLSLADRAEVLFQQQTGRSLDFSGGMPKAGDSSPLSPKDTPSGGIFPKGVFGYILDAAQPLTSTQASSLTKSSQWRRTLLFFVAQTLASLLIAAIGVQITSLFLSFKETFGHALMLATGSIGFRILVTGFCALVVFCQPDTATSIHSPLTNWLLALAAFYPFDVFLFRRIYQTPGGTSMRAGFLYLVWGQVILLLLAVMASATASSLAQTQS